MFREKNHIPVNTLEERVIKELLYYDIFDHPLSAEELSKDCSLPGDSEAILRSLVDRKLIFRHNGHYSVRPGNELSDHRSRGEKNAFNAMPKAIRMGKLIARFPFVKAVALSGSISKGYMDSFKDVDFFIITGRKRLWLARMLLVIYKRIFLANSFRYFCLNYFIDEGNLEIKDRNRFTATEINTMIPVSGNGFFREFYAMNNWVAAYYPDFPKNGTREIPGVNKSSLVRSVEWVLSGLPGNWLDLTAMRITVAYWRRKYRNDAGNLFDRSFRFKRDVAKYHPGNFQDRILGQYIRRVQSFESRMKVNLRDER